MSSFRRALLILMVVTVAGSAIALGRWQLRRLSDRLALNASLLAARTLPPLNLAEAPDSAGAVRGRRLIASGTFDTHQQILLRGRVQDEAPGLQVVTPLRLDGPAAEILWVVRGFVRSPDAVTPPEPLPPPDSGRVTVTGLSAVVEAKGDSGKPLRRGSVTTWDRIDLGTMRALAPHSLPYVLILAGDSTGVGRLEPAPPPALTNGPHLSYAIQWFGIALAAIVFGIIFLRRAGPGSVPPPGAP